MTDERDVSGELRVRLVREDEVAWYNALMAEHHSLGVAASGRVLRYVAEAGGVPLVLGTFGSAAWRVPVRDDLIGWDGQQRAARLERVCANQRLCVLPAASGVPHAASRALAGMLRRLPAGHLQAFGVRLVAVESFTDPATHAGTVYKACGFTAAGATAGYGRSRGRDHYVHHGRPKTCWLRELAPGGLAALKAGFDSPALTGRRGPDFNALDVGGKRGLLGYLGKVADHRKPKGVRHGLAAILTVVAVARLSGADSVYAAAQFAATMPQEALRRCGIRYNKRLGRHVPPSFKTIKRAVTAVDAKAADEQLCAWLRAEAAAGRLDWRHIAVDGKTMRGAARPDGTRPHLLSAYDVSAGTVLGQAEVDGKTNEITCFVPLLQAILDGRGAVRGSDGSEEDDGSGHGGAQAAAAAAAEEEEEEEEESRDQELVIVTADAMHTQAGHVEAMNALGVAWILTLKDNQPGLYAAADAWNWEDEPVLHATSEISRSRHEVRTIRVTSQIPDLIRERLPGTQQLALIERYRHPLRGREAAESCRAAGDEAPIACAQSYGTKLSCETVLAVTALTPAQAGSAFLLERNRDHWAIENGLHHRRDVTLGEDASRLRAGRSWRLFAALGNLTVSVLNRAGHRNHAAARRDYAWDRTGLRALELLGL